MATNRVVVLVRFRVRYFRFVCRRVLSSGGFGAFLNEWRLIVHPRGQIVRKTLDYPPLRVTYASSVKDVVRDNLFTPANVAGLTDYTCRLVGRR